jgi:ketol-acid reductoisomerase
MNSKLGNQTVAVLGYGNQGHAHALNLRDSGIQVIVGARPGKAAWKRAQADGFTPVEMAVAADQAQVVMFLLPDTEIPTVYQELLTKLPGKTIGFAHGFALHFRLIEKLPSCSYFLVGPKGAGDVLRARYLTGQGLPGVYAVAEPSNMGTEALAHEYAGAIGCGNVFLKKTTFHDETISDLFGEQVVLCGGLMELMEQAFEVLTENGIDPEMAFLECCFEAQLILQLWMKFGPSGMTERISPTAFYGGSTRGQFVLGAGSKERMQEVFRQIQSAEFAHEWMEQARQGSPELKKVRQAKQLALLEKTYQKLKAQLLENR